ncbi:BKACE family enzyme [Acuticoccus sediminis]|uniref:3-keto-5-aminohexanoate cleavage protein n=1 Tax=Acuticoccus sediminis TaxID=2184697 RepID=UPI001CFDEC7F|nr:3-keto-5-aminohexanoate cleavage protein [Acuticoccus sediminis]
MEATNDVWLEAALNGPWGRHRQPGIPVTISEIVAEGIACAEAGAAVIHLHAYDASTGLQKDDWEIYAAIFEGIRAKVDVIVYPSIPLAGDKGVAIEGGAAGRFAAVSRLADEGLIEWSVVDPGTANLARYRDIEGGRGGFVYRNDFADIDEGLSLADTKRFHPSYAIYEPGFLRLGAAAARQRPGMPAPLYRFMFSDEFTFGFPPKGYALEAYLALLAEEAPGSRWMVAGLGVDIDPLAELAMERGGGLRVGLEDAPFGTGRSNLDYVEAMVRRIVSSGRRPASAATIREAMAAA